MKDPFDRMSIESQLLASHLIDFLPNLASILMGWSAMPLLRSNTEAVLKLKEVLTPTQARKVAAQIRPKAPELAELLWPVS